MFHDDATITTITINNQQQRMVLFVHARSLIKLVSFLLVLPAILTYWHLRSLVQRSNLISVIPDVFLDTDQESHQGATTFRQGNNNNNNNKNRTVGLHNNYHHLSIFGIYQPTAQGLLFTRIVPFDRSFAVLSIANVASLLAPKRGWWFQNRHERRLQFQDLQHQCLSWSTPAQQQQQQPTALLLSGKWCTTRDDPTRYVYTPGPSETSKNEFGIRSIQVMPVVPIPSQGGSSSWLIPTMVQRSFNWRTMLGLGPSDFRFNPNRHTQQQQQLQYIPGQRYGGSPHPFVDQVFHRPATTILLVLNMLLAFVYWNRQVSPTAVAKNYVAIVQQYEWWRCFTGAMAHFDLWHLGFNMMTLQALGYELEKNIYGSIPFFLYNLSLMPITTTIFIGIGYIQQHYQQHYQQQLHRTASTTTTSSTTPTTATPTPSPLSSILALASTSGNTVGYSGVLFAWLVIASLEQEQTCPISFLPHVCFRTHAMSWGFKFSWAPWVSLVVTQMILPKRVSLVGHLSGILAGFLLHWNAFPLDLFQPSVLIPYAMVVGQWYYARHIIPIPPSNNNNNNNNETENHSQRMRRHVDAEIGSDDTLPLVVAATAASRRRQQGLSSIRRQREDPLSRLLWLAKVSMMCFLAGSFVIVLKRPWSSIVLSYGLATFVFHLAVTSHSRLTTTTTSVNNNSNNNGSDGEEKQRLMTIWKGFVVISVLTIAVDSMTLAGMLLLCWNAPQMHFAFVFLTLRSIFLLVPLTLACSHLMELDPVHYHHHHGNGGGAAGGIFTITLGYTVLTPAGLLGQALRHAASISTTPFQGQGIALGRAATAATAADGSTTRNEARQISPLL